MSKRRSPIRIPAGGMTLSWLLSLADTTNGADACWPWTGPRSPDGYARLSRHGVRIRVTRVILGRSLRRKLKRNELCCHRCNNPPCVNPMHLYAGSPADNTRDCVLSRRHWKTRITHCPKGHEYTEANTRWYIRPGGVRAGRNCKACSRMHRELYVMRHPEKIREKRRRDSRKAWALNRERFNAEALRRYHNNREKISARRKELRKLYPEKAHAADRIAYVRSRLKLAMEREKEREQGKP